MTSRPADRLRIAFVVNDMGYGGAELQVAELAERMARRGHDVLVVVLARFLDFEDRLRAAGVRTAALGMEYGRPSARGAWRLGRVLREHRVDVVHAHLLGASVMARFARILAPFPCLVSTAHSPFERSAARYALLGLTDPLTDVWTNVCSEGVATFVRKGATRAHKAQLTPNGIDVERFRPAPDRRAELRSKYGMTDRFVWLAVGSFRTEQKDYGTMADAVALLEPSGLDYEIWIAGTGSLLEEKRRMIIDRGLEHRMRLLGLRDDVGDLMLAADGFLMSSAWEAFPIVLLEASASAMPIVTTDVGDNAAIVEHDVTGLVTPPKDPRALAAAMERIQRLGHHARAELGRRGRARVEERFEIERVVDDWIAMYRRVLDGGSTKRSAA